MKKLLLTVLVLAKLFSADAQISLNYTKNFLPNQGTRVVNNRVVPQTLQQLTVGYSRQLAKSNFNVNASLAVAKDRPPGPVVPLYPCPECTIKTKAIPEGAILVMMKPQTIAFDALVGFGYTLPHKDGSRITFTANIDGGISKILEQEMQVSKNGKIIDAFPLLKYQKVIYPSIKMRIGLTDRLGINIGGGYSSIGNVNLITGLSFGPSRKKEK